ncbi:unnamed protein product [Calicophoron daubneyi]
MTLTKLPKELNLGKIGIPALEALDLYADDLRAYERKEILNYDKVYYVGKAADKTVLLSEPIDAPKNKGDQAHMQLALKNLKNEALPVFDDAENFYRAIKHDHIGYRFEIISSLGKGSFGQVFLALDHKNGNQVALKIIRTEPRFTRQAREEIRILETLRDLRKSNGKDIDDVNFPIIHLYEHFTFRKHICMSFELLSINLYDLLKLNKFAGLPRDRVRRISLQILKALYYIEKAGIIHCDLKPENVLLIWPPDKESYSSVRYSTATDFSSDVHKRREQLPVNPQQDFVKLIDFGSSCFRNGQMYPYIQSRFYRAPEVILRIGYTEAIDMWSFGCLVAELVNGLPLFPGEDERDQLACMMEVLGQPPNEMVRKSPNLTQFFIERHLKGNLSNGSSSTIEQTVTYYPRYCFVHYPNGMDGPAELKPGISPRGGHLRGVPGSVSLLKAILQPRHRRSRYKNTPQSMVDLTGQIKEEGGVLTDNDLLLGFVKSCLMWQPEERVKPYKAMQSLWLKNFLQKNVIRTLNDHRIHSMFVAKTPPEMEGVKIQNGTEELVKQAPTAFDVYSLCPRRRIRAEKRVDDDGCVNRTNRRSEPAIVPNGVSNHIKPTEENNLNQARAKTKSSVNLAAPNEFALSGVSFSPLRRGRDLSANGNFRLKSRFTNRHFTLVYADELADKNDEPAKPPSVKQEESYGYRVRSKNSIPEYSPIVACDYDKPSNNQPTFSHSRGSLTDPSIILTGSSNKPRYEGHGRPLNGPEDRGQGGVLKLPAEHMPRLYSTRNGFLLPPQHPYNPYTSRADRSEMQLQPNLLNNHIPLNRHRGRLQAVCLSGRPELGTAEDSRVNRTRVLRQNDPQNIQPISEICEKPMNNYSGQSGNGKVNSRYSLSVPYSDYPTFKETLKPTTEILKLNGCRRPNSTAFRDNAVCNASQPYINSNEITFHPNDGSQA